MSLISVLIPAYNHEKFVQETINSIIAQSYKNIELIIIDDGSKDATFAKICQMKAKCKKRFKRVVFKTQLNKGTCLTLNELLDLARGEFIYLIASDDKAKPHAIKKQLEFLLKNDDYALVVGDNEIIDENGKICFWDENQNTVYENAKYTSFAKKLQDDLNINFNSSKFGRYDILLKGNHIPNGYLVRKSIFDKVGKFTPLAPLEDYFLMLQISKYAKMKFLDEILFSYRWHSTNSIKNIKKMNEFDAMTRKYELNLLSKIQPNQNFFTRGF